MTAAEATVHGAAFVAAYNRLIGHGLRGHFMEIEDAGARVAAWEKDCQVIAYEEADSFVEAYRRTRRAARVKL